VHRRGEATLRLNSIPKKCIHVLSSLLRGRVVTNKLEKVVGLYNRTLYGVGVLVTFG
jgi:hypothetical protein